MIRLKQIHFEVPRGNICAFNWRYVEQKNKLVFDKALQRARSIKKFCDVPEADVKCYIVEIDTEAGYLSQNGDPVKSDEISREEVSLDYVKNLFKKL
jgi:hypothetical protein